MGSDDHCRVPDDPGLFVHGQMAHWRLPSPHQFSVNLKLGNKRSGKIQWFYTWKKSGREDCSWNLPGLHQTRRRTGEIIPKSLDKIWFWFLDLRRRVYSWHWQVGGTNEEPRWWCLPSRLEGRNWMFHPGTGNYGLHCGPGPPDTLLQILLLLLCLHGNLLINFIYF